MSAASWFRVPLPVAAAAVLVPPAAWLSIMTWGLGVDPAEAASAAILRVYYVMSIVLFVATAALEARKGRSGQAFVSAGLVLVLLQGAVLYGWRMSGSFGLGEGEAFSAYDTVLTGAWTEPRPVPLALVKPSTQEGDSCAVVLGGKELVLGPGEVVSWTDHDVRFDGWANAPLLILRDKEGREIEGGYYRLGLSTDEDEFVQFRLLPHRIYLSRPASARRVWKREEGMWVPGSIAGDTVSPADEDALLLQVARGKLTLYNGIIEKGQTVRFDGYTLLYADAARWARFEVRRRQTLSLLYAGAAMLLIGAVLWGRSRIMS